MAAEASVNARVTQEEARAMAVENQLSSAVRVETSRAMAAEQAINNAFGQSQVLLPGQIAATATQVVNAAVGGIASNLTNEVQARIEGDNTLRKAVETEVNRAMGAEGLLSTAIGVETSRAITAEQGISTIVSAIFVCPPNAVDAPACKCGPGFVGTLTWTGEAWTGNCTLAPCPAYAAGAPQCVCDSFTNGTLVWVGSSWSGTCAASPVVRSMSAGFVTCGVSSDQRIKCIGSSGFGMLGANSSSSVVANLSIALAIPSINNAVKVITGSQFSCALLTNSSLACWGGNGYGQTGVHKNTTTVSPTVVTSNVFDAAVGLEHTCALYFGGNLTCWGRNQFSQLGTSSMIDITSGVPAIVMATGVRQVTCAGTATCYVKIDGDLYCTGYITAGVTSTTHALQGNIGATGAVSCGYSHCCVISSGALRCWGARSSGQLGAGIFSSSAPFDSATTVFNSGIVRVALGSFHSCALNSSGLVSCWGGNAFGQVGNGLMTNQGTPVVVSFLTGVRDVFTGISASHVCATLTTGGFKCWGYNYYGQLGLGHFTNTPTPSNTTSFLFPA